jgi:hypothetical protein
MELDAAQEQQIMKRRAKPQILKMAVSGVTELLRVFSFSGKDRYCHGINFSLSKTDLARQSSLARLSLSLAYSLVFCLRLVCPTNPKDPNTLSMPQASGITQLNRIHNTTDYGNKSQPFH